MRQNRTIRLIVLVLSIYCFLLSIDIMGGAFKLLGEGFSLKLIQMTSSPYVGLVVGILSTSVVQSSSATTSVVVCLVGGGSLTISNAIPIVMGANVGTTVTNIFVSFGHVSRKEEFKRAFAGATVHDFFNLCALLVLFPLEVKFHFIEKMASFMAEAFSDMGGLTVVSPLKLIIAPASSRILHILGPKIGIIAALILLFAALRYIVSSMRFFTLDRFQVLLDRFLFKNDASSFVVGTVTTAIVQSSSVTTSLIVPLLGSGLLTLEQVYPYTLGANVGTTVTAILASLVTNQVAGVTIAFSHLLFNVFGITLFYPLRRFPIFCARWLAGLAAEKKIVAILFVVITFYVIPILLVFLSP
ncbi:MAG: Na/Pi symporter [Theionarchaea archaeon]|nr:Na/Pi symporter [Theionarchaea archaeon]MBU7038374.1 Na/Pi symporter [Theionarchaea archaeon]